MRHSVNRMLREFALIGSGTSELSKRPPSSEFNAYRVSYGEAVNKSISCSGLDVRFLCQGPDVLKNSVGRTGALSLWTSDVVWGRCELCNLRYASASGEQVALVRFRARACHSTWRHCPDFRAQPVQPLDEESSPIALLIAVRCSSPTRTTKYSMEAGLQDVGGCYILGDTIGPWIVANLG